LLDDRGSPLVGAVHGRLRIVDFQIVRIGVPLDCGDGVWIRIAVGPSSHGTYGDVRRTKRSRHTGGPLGRIALSRVGANDQTLGQVFGAEEAGECERHVPRGGRRDYRLLARRRALDGLGLTREEGLGNEMIRRSGRRSRGADQLDVGLQRGALDRERHRRGRNIEQQGKQAEQGDEAGANQVRAVGA